MALMTTFAEIERAAEAHEGGAEALAARLPTPRTVEELCALGDDRYLSLMSLRVFRAGLKHSLVDAKWPAFEEAFHGFEPRAVRAMNDEEAERLLSDKRLIRHGPKMRSVRANAAAVCALAEEKGGVGVYLADWPGGDIVGLWDDIAKRFTHMGGNSGAYFLRMAGKDSFILTDHVVRALNHWGAFEGQTKGKGARAKVQAAFNDWAAESGRPLCQISMILARSIE
jgi:3-methyladenine DNA glycosylase Tag